MEKTKEGAGHQDQQKKVMPKTEVAGAKKTS
jgi:hypothetical protein